MLSFLVLGMLFMPMRPVQTPVAFTGVSYVSVFAAWVRVDGMCATMRVNLFLEKEESVGVVYKQFDCAGSIEVEPIIDETRGYNVSVMQWDADGRVELETEEYSFFFEPDNGNPLLRHFRNGEHNAVWIGTAEVTTPWDEKTSSGDADMSLGFSDVIFPRRLPVLRR